MGFRNETSDFVASVFAPTLPLHVVVRSVSAPRQKNSSRHVVRRRADRAGGNSRSPRLGNPSGLRMARKGRDRGFAAEAGDYIGRGMFRGSATKKKRATLRPPALSPRVWRAGSAKSPAEAPPVVGPQPRGPASRPHACDLSRVGPDGNRAIGDPQRFPQESAVIPRRSAESLTPKPGAAAVAAARGAVRRKSAAPDGA